MIDNDYLVVVDIESTCWDGEPPEGQQSDIIEIGICLLNLKTLHISKADSYVIRPQRSTISSFCANLTGWTQVKVNAGISFAEACAEIKKHYSTKKRAWASYGAYDLRMFNKQCQCYEVEYPFSDQHLNVKELFNVMNGGHRPVGLGKALQKVGVEFKGQPHRGKDDAYNIAVLLSQMIEKGRGAIV